MGTKPVLVGLYITILFTLIALFALLIMTPVLLKQMDQLTNEWERDFDGVKVVSDEMWTDLLKMGAEMRLPRDRLRRQYEEFGGQQQAYERPSTSYSSYSTNSYNYPSQPVAPTYGYGLAKVKCCCAMKNIDYEGEHRNLPVSYKCPVGSQGPPGPTGEPGEDGQPGQPGYNGEDYPQVGPSSNSGSSQYTSGYGASQGYNDDPYNGGGYGSAAPAEKCEPCPRGLQGNPGTKGKPGPPGTKGEKGIQGVHGIPGVSGNQGSPGDVGVRGKSGTKGLPGPRGADATAGGKGLPGAKGQMGSIGVPGPRGVSGPAGSPGIDGRRGTVGIRGQRGQRGLDGVDGVQGPPGVPGADAGYCKCPDRVRDVQAAQSGYGNSESSGYGGNQRGRSGASPPSAVPQQDVYGTSRAMEHRSGVTTNEAIYNPLKTGETREYSTSVHVGDLQAQPVQGTRREYHPQQGPYQPPRSAYYSGHRDGSSEQHMHIRPASPYGRSNSRNEFSSDEAPVIQDWNDDVRRRQRLLLAQKRQRQRYFGRS